MPFWIWIVAAPRDSGYGFVGPDGGEYGAPTIDEAITLASDLYPDAEIRVESPDRPIYSPIPACSLDAWVKR